MVVETMITNATKTDNSLKMYRNYMKNIQFMHQYLEETEIFNSSSTEFKNFLIQSFAYLHSEFHYLSFLNDELIDQELLKVAGILQILPSNFCKKGLKLFDNMSESDVHKFWIKFFSLFNTNENEKFTVDETFNENCEKTDFLSSIENTLQYLNYNFPVLSSKKLKNANFDSEIESWNEDIVSNSVSNELTSYDCNIEEISETNLEKLSVDLKHISTMYTGVFSNKIEKEVEYNKFLIEFFDEAKSVLKYINDFNIINSKILQNYYPQLLLQNDDDWSRNLYFIKKCSNFVKVLKSKVV